MRLSSHRHGNLVLRVATAIVGVPLVLGAVAAGGWFFAALIALAAAVGTFELYGMEREMGYRPFMLIGVGASIVIVVLPFTQFAVQASWILVLTLLTASTGAVYLARPLYAGSYLNWVFTLVPVLYVGLMLGHLSLLRQAPAGAWWVALALLVTWAYDTGAFFAGSLAGRRPFMQHVSPSKTIEGVQGGLALSAIAGLAAAPMVGIAFWQGVLFGVGAGIVAQLGDLMESMVKRQAGVKDSGRLVPGHGGLLDRIDSLLFTGVLTYYAAVLLGHAS